MRALTLIQPWGGLVAASVKLVENRPRSMIRREDFGVPFAVHAGVKLDPAVYDRIKEIEPTLFIGADQQPWYRLSRITRAVIAVATVHDVGFIDGWSRASIEDLCAARGMPEQARWMFGPVVYLLRDIRALPTPVPCPGRQPFWRLPGSVERAVTKQLGRTQ